MKIYIKKRNGNLVEFDKTRIENAIKKASKEEIPNFDELIQDILKDIDKDIPTVEEIQDIVEKNLIKHNLYETSKSYILYRAKRTEIRLEKQKEWFEKATHGELNIKKRDNTLTKFNPEKISKTVERASKGLNVSQTSILKEFMKNIYDGISTKEIYQALILTTTSFMERDPDYDKVSSNIFLEKMYKEVLENDYKTTFINNIKKGVEKEIYSKELLTFDLEKLANNIDPNKDQLLKYLGLQTLYERYLVKSDNKHLEVPQTFWMRVAMGLSLNEEDKTKKAIEFYEVLSTLRFVASTPTLFHSGLTRPQLSSCYLSKVDDDLNHIFKCIGDNAQMSKWSGGIGNDWTAVRATGATIKSTRVESQGIIPFLKIANDTTLAINRSGKRRGATCAYLETWHLDIEDFLDLRKNTGDDRRRTHDMNTANWIPDLFMKRVINDENWTLFSPEEVPDLHEIYGKEFEKQYINYEKLANEGKIKKFKIIEAKKLWRKMLTQLFETGHPWLTFKDPCNIRSPQDHVGVIHNSNLCTEITLNNSADETAVCNLGSINLEKHIENKSLNKELLEKTINTAIRMLDNVIDINFYPTIEGETSNLKHRPIGLGLMGFQDALFMLNIGFESQEAINFTDEMMETISYYAINASSDLAKEKGAYETFKGSKWDRGIFPFDTLELLEKEREIKIPIPKTKKLDWDKLKQKVKENKLRNSNLMAIAPTATIANISGVYPCIEPIYKNIYVKANMSGEFTIINNYLVDDLKKLNLWNQDMLEQIKYYDGNLDNISQIPQELKDKYKEAFSIDPRALINLTAIRQKWIDQSQSHNVFMQGVSGKKLDETYRYAWQMGLKTTYYLRSLAASQIEKSTLDAKKYGFTQKRTTPASEIKSVCSIMDPDCESCQ